MLEDFQNGDYSFGSIQEMNDNLQYIDYINRNYVFNTQTVDPAMAYRYKGNFFGLLKEFNVNPNVFLYTLYINGYTNPRQFAGDKYTFLIAIKPAIPTS